MFDTEYRDRIHTAILDAIVKTSMADGNISLIKSGEVTDVCIAIIATFAAGSEETSSPTKRRHLADQVAKKLINRIIGLQEYVAKNGLPEHVINLTAKDIQ